MKKNILITGAAGFIGASLSLALKNKGYTVYGIDNLSVKPVRPFNDIIKIDVQSISHDFLIERDINQIVHLAAKKMLKSHFII